jgi:hypothetical protein
MTDNPTIQDLDPRPPLWFRKVVFGLGLLTVVYAGFTLASLMLGGEFVLPTAAEATLCDQLAYLVPVGFGLLGMMFIKFAGVRGLLENYT